MKNFGPKVELRDPASLIPYGDNAKKHSPAQIDDLAAMIHRFGFDQPIVVDDQGVIIKGHARRQAALRLGLSEVPVIVRSDLDAYEVKATRLADNAVAEGQEYDVDKLRFELGTLNRAEFDMRLTGMNAQQLEDLLKEADEAPLPVLPGVASDDEEVLDPTTETGTVTLPDSASFARYRIPLTDEVSDRFVAAIEAWKAQHGGSADGLVDALLDAYAEQGMHPIDTGPYGGDEEHDDDPNADVFDHQDAVDKAGTDDGEES